MKRLRWEINIHGVGFSVVGDRWQNLWVIGLIRSVIHHHVELEC